MIFSRVVRRPGRSKCHAGHPDNMSGVCLCPHSYYDRACASWPGLSLEPPSKKSRNWSIGKGDKSIKCSVGDTVCCKSVSVRAERTRASTFSRVPSPSW
uniref:Uncharacterized protein n=1 Tax=Hyaloperonospora arabidopsidis (strain Emoy2) TaxID=559515 RepID=M4B3G0_HYAAE